MPQWWLTRRARRQGLGVPEQRPHAGFVHRGDGGREPVRFVPTTEPGVFTPVTVDGRVVDVADGVHGCDGCCNPPATTREPARHA